MKDRKGTLHDYSYDQHGRLLHDSVSTLAAGLDGTVRRISRTYDPAGRRTRVLTPVYAGVGMPVKMTYPQPGLQWTLLAQSGESTSGNKIPYTGLDRFGRIIQARWLTNASTPATRVHVNYWYDRGSRRIWRETPNAPTGNKEAESYLYDGLSQVTRRQRGALERDSQGAIPLDSDEGRNDAIDAMKTIAAQFPVLE